MKMTAFFLAAYFLLGSCFPANDFSQLARMSTVASHYQDHRAEALKNGEFLSLPEFWSIHFLSTKDHKQDHPVDHQDLPYQSIHSTLTFTIGDYPVHLPILRSKCGSGLPGFLSELHLSGYAISVFQPPSVSCSSSGQLS